MLKGLMKPGTKYIRCNTRDNTPLGMHARANYFRTGEHTDDENTRPWKHSIDSLTCVVHSIRRTIALYPYAIKSAWRIGRVCVSLLPYVLYIRLFLVLCGTILFLHVADECTHVDSLEYERGDTWYTVLASSHQKTYCVICGTILSHVLRAMRYYLLFSHVIGEGAYFDSLEHERGDRTAAPIDRPTETSGNN